MTAAGIPDVATDANRLLRLLPPCQGKSRASETTNSLQASLRLPKQYDCACREPPISFVHVSTCERDGGIAERVGLSQTLPILYTSICEGRRDRIRHVLAVHLTGPYECHGPPYWTTTVVCSALLSNLAPSLDASMMIEAFHFLTTTPELSYT